MPKRERVPRPASYVRNFPVYVDPVDWADVTSGRKSELRKYGQSKPLPGRERKFPAACVFYTERSVGEIQTALGVVEDQWNEPLGAISPESLAREGFPDDLPGFRRYFAARYPRGGFRPLAGVVVQVIRPMNDDDATRTMLETWEHLYGRYA